MPFPCWCPHGKRTMQEACSSPHRHDVASVTVTETSAEAQADEWFARNFRAAREAAGMSQAAVAAQMRDLGFPRFEQQTILRVESDGRRVSVGEGIALGRIVGVSHDVLAQPPDLMKARARLSSVTLHLRELREQERGIRIARDATEQHLERLVAEARDGDMAAGLADEIAEAEKVLKEVRP